MKKYPFKHNEPDEKFDLPFTLEDDAEVVLTPEEEKDIERFSKLSLEEMLAEMRAETEAMNLKPKW